LPRARRISDLVDHPRRDDRVVALTFDDGPHPTTTEEILEILEDLDVPATFFMVGSHAERQPEIVRRVASTPHGIGNHSYAHFSLTSAPRRAGLRDIKQGRHTLEALTGRSIPLFRPPSGDFDERTLRRLRRRAHTVVMWSVDTRDWTQPGVDAIVDEVRSSVHPGAIVLLHDGGGDRTQTVTALPRVIEAVIADGYEIVALWPAT
jgi:peptidoglycan/xylan/chitin deacetylase (PgdA/CDA1 family)